jgi:type II secretory pathway component PulK
MNRRVRKTGFMTMVALLMLALVSAAMVSMTVAMNVDHRRTESQAVQAQLRQMLLAGAESLPTDASHLDGRRQKWAIATPAAEISVFAESTPATDGSVSVRLDAAIAKHRLEETVQLHRDGQRWAAVSIKLD